MKPAAPEGCRLLELGCGDGSNLVPMAATLKDSEFVGLDLEPQALAQARERAAALGARNVTFVEADLATLEPDQLGRFDYVVAHGVYSWVPQAVAERLLGVCRTALEKQGRLRQLLLKASLLALADLWLRGYDANLIQLHSHASPLASVPGDRPRSSQVARRQLALGDETVTSLDHETVGLDERMRRLVELADGTRDRENAGP